MVDCSRVTDTILAQRGIGSVIKQSIPDEADDANEESNEVRNISIYFVIGVWLSNNLLNKSIYFFTTLRKLSNTILNRI